jgi:hypothetical protein
VPQVALLAYVVQLTLMHSTNMQEWISLTLILLHSSSIPKLKREKKKMCEFLGGVKLELGNKILLPNSSKNPEESKMTMR